VCSNTSADLILLWAIWASGHVAVPLQVGEGQLQGAIRDSKCRILIARREVADDVSALCCVTKKRRKTKGFLGDFFIEM
jgi:hypothetical protein